MNIIEQIPDNFDNVAWVDQNAVAIYKTMREMIKDRKLVETVIKNLLLIYPALLNRGDLRKWAKLTNRADRKLTRMEMRRIQKPEQSYRQPYVITPVAAARAKPRKPRSERLNQREMFEVYLKLMMSQIFSYSDELALKTMQSALAFARRVNDPYYYNKLYQTLAYIHLEHREFDKALNQARLAYQYWHGHPDKIEEGLTAFAIATAYRGQHNWKQAREWLHKSGDLLSKVDYRRSYGIVALGVACLDVSLREFESACQWSAIALKEFQSENMHYHAGLAYHNLGLSQAYDGQFDDAIDNLWRAINYWESVDNLFQQVHAEHSLAFAEARMGKTERALMRLERNRSLCRHVQNASTKERHLQQVERLEEAIRNGEDLVSVFTIAERVLV
jgi:tetratricopeptide (TPR) repeat protein